MDSIHPQSANDVFKSEFNRFLMTSVIDKIDNDSIAIDINLFLEMFPRRFNLRRQFRKPMRTLQLSRDFQKSAV